MAEAVGAIASIFGIIGAGAKLSIVLFDVASSIGSAGSQVRAIGTEISLFCAVLKQLERTLAKAKDRRYSITAIETTQQILDQCQTIFEDISAIVGGLQKQKPQSSETSVDFKARIKWILKRSKVQTHRATLESCKITLHIMLTTLEFAQTISSRRVSTIETDFEDEQEEIMTRSLVIAQKCAVERLEKLEDVEDELVSDKKAVSPKPRLSSAVSPEFRDGPCWRTSVWLNDLISKDDTVPRTYRRSNTGELNSLPGVPQLPNLLWKWTDQGQHWDRLHEKDHDRTDDTGQSSTEPLGKSTFYHDGEVPNERSDSLPDYSPTTTVFTHQLGAKSQIDKSSPPSAQSNSWPTSPESSHTWPKTHSPMTIRGDIPLMTPPLTPIGMSQGLSHTTEKTAQSAWSWRLQTQVVPAKKSRKLPSPLSPSKPAADTQTRSTPTSPRTPAPLTPSIFRRLHVTDDDTCASILPAILKTYSLKPDSTHYILVLAYEDGERLVQPSEKPRALFRQLRREGKEPTFMLRTVGATAIASQDRGVAGGML